MKGSREPAADGKWRYTVSNSLGNLSGAYELDAKGMPVKITLELAQGIVSTRER